MVLVAWKERAPLFSTDRASRCRWCRSLRQAFLSADIARIRVRQAGCSAHPASNRTSDFNHRLALAAGKRRDHRHDVARSPAACAGSPGIPARTLGMDRCSHCVHRTMLPAWRHDSCSNPLGRPSRHASPSERRPLATSLPTSMRRGASNRSTRMLALSGNDRRGQFRCAHKCVHRRIEVVGHALQDARSGCAGLPTEQIFLRTFAQSGLCGAGKPQVPRRGRTVPVHLRNDVRAARRRMRACFAPLARLPVRCMKRP